MTLGMFSTDKQMIPSNHACRGTPDNITNMY